MHKRNLYVCINSKIPPQKNPRQMHFIAICRPKFQTFSLRCIPLGVYHWVYTTGATPRSHWAKRTLKKLNLWGKTAVKKNAWIKHSGQHTPPTKNGIKSQLPPSPFFVLPREMRKKSPLFSPFPPPRFWN